jgi:ribosomal protein L1
LKKRVGPTDKKGKELKKWARNYRPLFISETLVMHLAKLGGPFLTKWNGKITNSIQQTQTEYIRAKVDEGLQTVNFQLKKVLYLGIAVANVSVKEEQIRQNSIMSSNYLIY